MKIHVDSDDRYPDYNIALQPGSFTVELEVDDKTAKRWLRAIRAFNEVQSEIEDALEGRSWRNP
jgi:hypothetical protein